MRRADHGFVIQLSCGAIFARQGPRKGSPMRKMVTDPTSLRGEAAILAAAGLIVLGVSLPLTLALVAMALSPDGFSPFVPMIIGGPPMLLGYLACHFASSKYEKAKKLEGAKKKVRKKRAPKAAA